MKTDKERLAGWVAAFEKAIIDRLAEVAKANLVDGKATYVPSTAVWLKAGFDAWQEMIESETEPIGPMLAVAAWENVMKTNESAFSQSLARLEKAGQLGFAVKRAGRSPKSLAAGYLT